MTVCGVSEKYAGWNGSRTVVRGDGDCVGATAAWCGVVWVVRGRWMTRREQRCVNAWSRVEWDGVERRLSGVAAWLCLVLSSEIPTYRAAAAVSVAVVRKAFVCPHLYQPAVLVVSVSEQLLLSSQTKPYIHKSYSAVSCFTTLSQLAAHTRHDRCWNGAEISSLAAR